MLVTLSVLSGLFFIGGCLLLYVGIIPNAGEPSQVLFGAVLFGQGVVNFCLLANRRLRERFLPGNKASDPVET